jgi:hypothetical protein
VLPLKLIENCCHSPIRVTYQGQVHKSTDRSFVVSTRMEITRDYPAILHDHRVFRRDYHLGAAVKIEKPFLMSDNTKEQIQVR